MDRIENYPGHALGDGHIECYQQLDSIDEETEDSLMKVVMIQIAHLMIHLKTILRMGVDDPSKGLVLPDGTKIEQFFKLFRFGTEEEIELFRRICYNLKVQISERKLYKSTINPTSK